MNSNKTELIDPSLTDGGDVVYDKDILLDYRDENDTLIENAPFHLRLILHYTDQIKEEKKNKLDKFRFEITMDANIFFFYICEMDENYYQNFAKDAGIAINFSSFPNQVIQYIDSVQSKCQNITVEFCSKTEDEYVISFSQTLSIRKINLFELHFSPESDDFINKQVQYRYDLTIKNLKEAKEERAEVTGMIKTTKENFIVKTPPRNSPSVTQKSPVSPKNEMNLPSPVLQ